MDEIVAILGRYRIPFGSEFRLQETVELILIENGLTYIREKSLRATDRIDFLVGAIGIECKVDGSKTSVFSQLLRYAESPEIEGLILLTTRNTHRFSEDKLLGKPFRLFRINGL